MEPQTTTPPEYTIPDFLFWLQRDLTRFCAYAKCVQQCGNGGGVSEDGCYLNTMHLRIYTATNSYLITATEHYRQVTSGSPPTLQRAYLGCVATSRTPRPGETWSRGRDLADGPLTPETWVRILADIVSYEMVRLAPPIRQQAAPDADADREPGGQM